MVHGTDVYVAAAHRQFYCLGWFVFQFQTKTRRLKLKLLVFPVSRVADTVDSWDLTLSVVTPHLVHVKSRHVPEWRRPHKLRPYVYRLPSGTWESKGRHLGREGKVQVTSKGEWLPCGSRCMFAGRQRGSITALATVLQWECTYVQLFTVS